MIHGKGLIGGHDKHTGYYTDKPDQPGEGDKAIALRECRNVTLLSLTAIIALALPKEYIPIERHGCKQPISQGSSLTTWRRAGVFRKALSLAVRMARGL